MANTSNTSATININLDIDTLVRIASAYLRDREEVSKTEQEFDEWLTSIILDWVSEVEKSVPTRE